MSKLTDKEYKDLYFKLRKKIVLLAEELRDDPIYYSFPIKELTKILEES